MIAPEPTAPRDPREARSPVAPSPGIGAGPGADPAGRTVRHSAEPVGTLRGAGVNVDTRRAAQAAAVVGLVAVAVVAVVLFAAGYQKNAQITNLKTHGVAVDATVADCIGLLGGSGSNDAGYNCTARYAFDGRNYAEGIPGNGQLLTAGSTVKGVVASDDPALFSTPATLAGEHTSARVYLAPSILAGLVLVLSAGWVVVRRRARPAGGSAT
jgi:hypothetical protein